MVQRPGKTLNHDVVARTAVEDVLAGAADKHVVSGIAVESIVPGATDQDIVAIAAIGGELEASAIVLS
jgi:hypothetical protein